LTFCFDLLLNPACCELPILYYV